MLAKHFSQSIAVSLNVAVLMISLSQATLAEVTVKDWQACIPDWNGYFERSELVSQTQADAKEYFLLYLYQPGTQSPDPLVISRPVGGGECTQEFLNVTGDDVSLSQALGSREVGRQLTLGIYQKDLERLGRDGLQRHVNEAASGAAPVEWHDEHVWALQQLGIVIPDNVRVVSPERLQVSPEK